MVFSLRRCLWLGLTYNIDGDEKMTSVTFAQAGNEWNSVFESAIREKPQFIKRTREYMFLSDIGILENLLSAYTFHAEILPEDDGSVTMSLDEIDLVENGMDESATLLKLAKSILEYSQDYYANFAAWCKGEREAHLPYVLKFLILDDAKKIGGLIECRRGKI